MTKKIKPEFKVNFSIAEMLQRFTDYALEPVFRFPNSNQIVIPHHVEPHKWVGLGAVTYTTDELLNSRATPELQCLWSRPWTEKIIFQGKNRSFSSAELKILIKARL
jgi:hypothetical protein